MRSADADILVSLNQKQDPTDNFVQAIRTRLQREFPGVSYWYPPADIVAQILNFGLPAPLDIQIIGANRAANSVFARNLLEKVRRVAGAGHVGIQEPTERPPLARSSDRSTAAFLRLTPH